MALKQVGERSPHEEEIAHAKAGKHERRDHGTYCPAQLGLLEQDT